MLRIQNHDDEFDTIELSEGGNELQIYHSPASNSTGQRLVLYWCGGENNHEFEIEAYPSQYQETLETLRDWINDRLWELKHEAAA